MTSSDLPTVWRTTRQHNLGLPDWLSITFQSHITPHSSGYKSASLKNRGNGPSLTTRRPGGSREREGGFCWRCPLSRPQPGPVLCGGRRAWLFHSARTPPTPALPLRLRHLPQRRTHTRPKGDCSGITETQTGTSSPDIMGFPTSENK